MHFELNGLSVSRRTRTARAASGLALLASLPVLLSGIGCGANYRPVIASINPVGPAAQPQKYAVAISQPSAIAAGLVNIVDFSGDNVEVTAALGVAPYYLALSSAGEGYTLNGDGTVNSFAISTSLIQSQVNQSTLPADSGPVSIYPQGTYLYIAQSGLNAVAQFGATVPPTIQQELPTGPGSIYTVGATSSPRAYAIVQGSSTVAPHVTAIETGTNTISNTIGTGLDPVYGVMTADSRRAFIMNKGSNTVTVINAQTNALDNFTTFANGTIPVGTAPVWADFNPTSNQLLVLNQGDGVHAGSVTVVSIPLCSATAPTTDPNCDPNNPVDAAQFGTVVATIPVGINPSVIAVLQDGTQAFVVNQGSASDPTGTDTGSVSILNLTYDTVIATLPAASVNTTESDALVHGHPAFVAVTTGLPAGKAYITALDSNDMTIIRSDVDAVTAHVNLQGKGVQVRVTAP